MNTYPVIIAGGGITGLATAIALQQCAIPFVLLEAAPEIKPLGAGITLAGNAINVLRELGAEEAVADKGFRIDSMKVQDSRGRLISALSPNSIPQMKKLYNLAIHRAALHDALLSYLPANSFRTNSKVIALRQKESTVVASLQDGSEIEGRMLLAADGIHSVVRKKLLPDSHVRYAGYTCWRGIARTKIDKTDAIEIWGAAGRFGYVPVQEGVVYWFACKNAPQKDQTMSQWSIRELRANFETYGNTVKTLLDHTAPDTLIWSDIIDLKPIHQFAFGRIALLGDAAHATTPNLGQGACQGIEDALALQKALLAFPENDVKALQHFQQTRLKRTHQIVNTSWRLGKLAQIENAIITVIRNGLFRAIPEKINIRQTARILGMS